MLAALVVLCAHWSILAGGHVIRLECVPRGATATVQVGRRRFTRHAPGHARRVCPVGSYVFGYRDVTVTVAPIPVGGRVAVVIDGEGGGTRC